VLLRHGLECLGHLCRRAACLWSLQEQPKDELPQAGRYPRIALQQGPEVRAEDVPGAFLILSCIHGRRVLAHDEPVGGDAQGIEVIRGSGWVIAIAVASQADVEQASLRREVFRSERSQRLPGEAGSPLEMAGAEVDEHRQPVRQLYQYVVALHVAVHSACGMKRFQGTSQLSQHPAQLLARRGVLLGPGI
jgi:hypothetical protein